MTWDPAPYLVYSDHRLRPALDLLQRIPPEDPGSIVDLGCGAGNVTKVLRQRWPLAKVTGVDGSPAMLDRARTADAAVDWRLGDLRDWSPPVHRRPVLRRPAPGAAPSGRAGQSVKPEGCRARACNG